MISSELAAPLVTIMIPTYNQAQVVGQAIESALRQNYPNLEIVIADDSSSDDTASSVGRFRSDPRVRYFRNERRLGRVANYRRALYELTTGEWVLNLDGDDYLIDNAFVADAIAAVAGRPDIVMAVAGYQVALSRGPHRTELPTHTKFEVVDGRTFFHPPFRPLIAAHLSTLYRRKIAIEIGFYAHDIPHSDRESTVRLSLHGKVALMGRAVGVWRLHGGNTSMNLGRRDLEANLAVFHGPYRHAVEAGVAKQYAEAWRDRWLSQYVAANAPLVASGRFRDALRVLKALRPYPRAYRAAIAQCVLNPKVLGTWISLALGGRRLVLAAQSRWRGMTWRRRSR